MLTNAVGVPIDDWNTLLYFHNRLDKAEEVIRRGQRKRRNFQGEIRGQGGGYGMQIEWVIWRCRCLGVSGCLPVRYLFLGLDIAEADKLTSYQGATVF